MCKDMSLFILATWVLCFGVDIYAQEIGVRANHVEPDPDCILDKETERVQVAYVIDNTASNEFFFKILAKSLEGMMKKINDLHDGTEFALTCHADWPSSAYKAEKTGPEDCYSRYSNFTTSFKSITEAANKVPFLTSSGTIYAEENGVAALAFAASDKQLGWISEERDSTNRRVHRFLLFVTDQWSIFNLTKPGDRQPFRGDGTDTCSTSLPPPLSQLGEILKKTNTRIIGVYLTSKCFGEYTDGFKTAGFGERHVAKDFSKQKAKNNPDEFSKELSEYVADEIKRFLRCVFADPPAFNTLGL